MRFIFTLAAWLLVGNILCQQAQAQSTSWIGSQNSNWRNPNNWTNGVPDATKDVIIGDGSYVGPSSPQIPGASGSGICKSLTVGSSGIAIVLDLQDDITVLGSVTIGPVGTIQQGTVNLTLGGDWINNHNSSSYGPSALASPKVYFSGSAQTIGGSASTTFQKVIINTGSTTTLARNITVQSGLDINGTLDPTESFSVTGTTTIGTNGTAKVKAATVAGNYSVNPNPTTSTSTIDYASSINTQTVASAISYKRLLISGTTTKTPDGNLTIANDVAINGGTLDLADKTANRSAAGGSFTMASGTTLRIGGINSFPSNYSSVTLASSSTVEYYGLTNQPVSAQTYGHLKFSTSSGSITKVMPAAAFTVSGNFTTTTGGASTLIFTALNSVSVSGNVDLSAATTFTGGAFSHSVGGNWVNAGTFSGCGGTVTFTGGGASMSGTGTNQFGNVVVSGNGFTVNAATSLSVCGNFSTTGGGSFTHTTGGAGTMSMTTASAKSISGSNISFDDLSITGGSVATTSSFTIQGDFAVNGGTFSATAGTMTWTGAGKTFSGASATQASALSVSGSYTTARDLSISGNFSVAGSFTQTSNTTFFNGTSTFSGTASLFNMQISASSALTMGGNSTLRVAGTQVLGASATLNTSSNVPNTFVFNSTGSQTIVYTAFNNITVQGGNTKTPSAALTIGGNLTIAAGTTFDATTFSHSLAGNFINNGTFTKGTSTVTLNGTLDASITGITSFNILTVNKGTANVVSLNDNVTTATLNMTSGKMLTGSSSVTITTTRTGPGIIMGTITRTHAFGTGTNYEFESPDNFVNFTAALNVTSVTVTVVNALVTNFPSGVSVNRKYTITVTATSYTANLRLHYEQAEINGNSEGAMSMWNDQGINIWTSRGKSSNDVGNNWVELDGQISINNSWTMSDGQNILSWDGSASTAWDDPANWTATAGSPGPIPTLNETVQIGDLVFTNAPVIATAAQAKNISFFSNTPTTLSIVSSGVLVVQGNIQGNWSSNATHTINVGSRILTTFSDLVLSDGTAGHAINLTGTTGFVNVNGSLTQSGGANITFTSSGNLSISGNYNRTSGTYSGSPSGVVTYNGSTDQVIANLTYQNLTIDKLTGLATTSTALTINGDLQVLTGGTLRTNGDLTVGGSVTVASGTVLDTPASDITVAGDWTVAGSFNPGSGTVTFSGSGAQAMSGGSFNNITVNKPSGTLTVNGNLSLNGNININSGTVDVNTRNVARTVTGGTAALGAGAIARFSGTGFQIMNFGSLIANPTSTVEYYGTSARPIPPVTFGHLLITGTGTKTMVAATTILGDLTVNAGATLVLPSTTLNVAGNITANGSLNANSGTLILDGVSKNLANTGTISYNNVVVNGNYVLTSGNVDFNGYLQVNTGATLNLGSATVNSSGDLTNSGTLVSSGTVTFLGTQLQTIRLLNAVSSTSTGVINFNGTVSPELHSNTSPVFATVNINNTSPITVSEGWTVVVAMNVAASATWNGGPFTHTIAGAFTNNGTANSTGKIRFIPPTTATINLGSSFNSTGKVEFGGAGAMTILGSTSSFASIDFTNTNAAGVTIPTGWTLTHDLLIGPGTTVNGSTFTHSIAGTWTNNGTFNGNSSTVTFTSTSTTDEIRGTGTTNFNNVLFAAGSTMTVVAPVNVIGNWTNNATSVLLHYGNVKFIGTGTSNISGTTLTDFHDLEIDKSSGLVQLTRDVSINNTLALTNAPFSLNDHKATVSNSSASAVTRTNGYILSESTTFAGLFDWIIGSDVTLHEIPYGTSTGDYIPMQFTLTSGTAGTVTTSTYHTDAANLPLPPGVTHVFNATGTSNANNTVDRFFWINTSGVSPVATVTLSASPAEVGTITNLLGQRWNGTYWDDPLAGQTANATSVTIPGIIQFSPWAISGNFNALPIRLLSFNATLDGNKVVVQWETASELNNDFFEIQKSQNGKDFFSIGTVRGSGTTNDSRTYSLKDYEISAGRWFYRLKQVDFDKHSTMSGVVAVNIGDLDPIDFQLAPNPVVEKLAISSTSNFLDDMAVTIFDASGKIAYNWKHPAFGQDEIASVDLGHLASGVYVVNIQYGGFTKSYRVVKK